MMDNTKRTYWIDVANPMHSNAVTSGCDVGGSTTS